MRQLYTFFRSSASYRVRIALALKGLDWDSQYVSLPRMEHRAPEFLGRNPQGLVPVLVEDGAVLSQSLAIIEYLEETHPQPALLPGPALDRAYVRALSLAIACDIHPLNNVRVLKWLKSRWSLSDDDTNEWYAHWIVAGFEAIEAMLSQGRSGLFCLGDTPTMADVCLLPQVFNARRFNCDLGAYPLSVAIADRLAALPALERAHPAVQADAF